MIQFLPGGELAAGRCQGRVEHIASAQTARFGSFAELLAFVARVLAEEREAGRDGAERA